MSHDPSDFKFALAVGVAGAYVDVTTDVLFDSGSITRSWGTQSQFTPVAPGIYSFTLDNTTGKYSSDNPNSSLATLLGEGTGVNWSLNGQQRAGQVRALQPLFTDIGVPAASAQMRVTVTDMLGVGALNTLGNLAYSAAIANAYVFWPFNDAANAGQAVEATGNGNPFSSGTMAPVLGTSPLLATSETQLQLSTGDFGAPAKATSITFANGVIGYWAAWFNITQFSGTSLPISIAWGSGLGLSFGLGTSGTLVFFAQYQTNPVVNIPVPSGPTYIAVGVTYVGLSVTTTVYVNGVSLGSSSATVASIPVPTSLSASISARGMLSTDSITISHLSFSPVLIHEEFAGITTEANRLALIDQTSQLVTLGTLPTDLSTATVGYAATTGQSATDALNAVVLTEQGYIDTVTTGTLLAPVQSIRIRARNRPTAITASFAVAVDLSGAPTFARSLSDEISLEKVSGANGTTQTYINTSLITRVGSANGSDTILTFQQSDLYEWASDRVWRGIKRFTDITSITLDARGGSGSSLWNTLTSLNPGDRIEITGLPSAQLGYGTWDGFLIGASENHIDITQSQFTLYLAPATPATMIWDTDLWANGGNNTISTALTSGAASMLCTSADVVTLFETSAMNYYLQVDAEIVKVTACTAPVAGVQTLTITRAQFSTTAAAHAVGVVPEVYADSTGRLNNAYWAF